MALADYRLCNVCNGKTFCDSALDYQIPTPERIAAGHYEWWLDGIGDWAVICPNCAKTHEVIVRLKNKT